MNRIGAEILHAMITALHHSGQMSPRFQEFLEKQSALLANRVRIYKLVKDGRLACFIDDSFIGNFDTRAEAITAIAEHRLRGAAGMLEHFFKTGERKTIEEIL
jgi:hypothetical protein